MLTREVTEGVERSILEYSNYVVKEGDEEEVVKD
jgi:hypothetical protein